MPDHFELPASQLAASLNAVAETMRNCAQMAEAFAQIVNDIAHSQDTADLLHGASEPSGKGKRKAVASPDDGEGPKKRKRNVKPKDPNAPKRPASSYILFQNEVRKELKEKHPELSNADLLGLISEQWKNMSEEHRETYNQAVKAAKAQYSEEKKAYDNRTPEEIDAANAATAAAAATKKATKPRGKAAAAVPAAEVPARPPPAQTSPSSESASDDEESDAGASPQHDVKEPEAHSSESESDDDEPAPPPPPSKKKRGGSVQPTAQKSKKNSKA